MKQPNFNTVDIKREKCYAQYVTRDETTKNMLRFCTDIAIPAKYKDSDRFV